MKKLHSMVLSQITTIFFITVGVFTFFLLLIDMISNLNLLLRAEVDFVTVLIPSLWFIPKAISYSLSFSLLFSVSFTLGTLYANNELVAILNSGFSLKKLVTPVMFLGLGVSLFAFAFDDRVVIATLKIKNELTSQITGTTQSTSASYVTAYSAQGRIIYHGVNYNDKEKKLSTLIVLKRTGTDLIRMDAETANWTGDRWLLKQVRIFEMKKSSSSVTETYQALVDDPELTEPPEIFRRQVTKLEEMTLLEASDFIQAQKSAGFPTLEAETEFWVRISFSLTPLVVAFLSSAVGGRFKKNILIFSLFLSLVIGVVYYVLQLVFTILAKTGVVPVMVGAWGHFLLAAGTGVILFRKART